MSSLLSPLPQHLSHIPTNSFILHPSTHKLLYLEQPKKRGHFLKVPLELIEERSGRGGMQGFEVWRGLEVLGVDVCEMNVGCS